MKHASILKLSKDYADAQLERRQKHQDKMNSLERMLEQVTDGIRRRAVEDTQNYATLFNNLIKEEQEAINKIDATLASEEEE
jgi:hypothetical protein